MIRVYLVLCILGTVLPYTAFLLWLFENGFDIPLFFDAIASSNIAMFAWFDVVVSSIAMVFYILVHGPKNSVPYWWLAIVATLSIGVSLGLPLYLILSEIATSKKETNDF